jgi:hypothetical protein
MVCVGIRISIVGATAREGTRGHDGVGDAVDYVKTGTTRAACVDLVESRIDTDHAQAWDGVYYHVR